MAWIKCTLEYNGKDTYINTRHIATINVDCRNPVNGITCIGLSGEEDMYVHVKESVEEVYSRIKLAESQEVLLRG